MCKIAVMIPAYNEEASIVETVSEYKSVFPNAQIVVIDNNSIDATSELSRGVLDPATDILLLETRQGKGLAIKNGISRIDADVYVMTDADATYPADNARALVEEMLKTRGDMIVGDRISGGDYSAQNKRLGHGWGNRFLTAIISYFAGQRYSDVLSGLRVMSRPFVSSLDVQSKGFQLETELNVIAAHLKASVIEIPIQYRQRGTNSHSKLNTVRDGIKIMGFAFTNWFGFAPLQPLAILAMIMAATSGALGYRVIAGFIETGWPYTTTAIGAVAAGLVAALSIFFGLSLRLLIESNRRKEIAQFLELKRKWNSKLDASDD